MPSVLPTTRARFSIARKLTPYPVVTKRSPLRVGAHHQAPSMFLMNSYG